MISPILPGRDPRVRFDRAVWIGQAGTHGRLRKLYAENLSRGGMFLRTAEPLPIGEPLMIALDSSQEIVPLAQAEVVWHRPVSKHLSASSPPGIGIAFKDLQPDAKALLELLLFDEKVQEEVSAPRTGLSEEPPTPTFTPGDDLGPEPQTLFAAPTVQPVAVPPPLPRSETRAFWTGFNLPNRHRVKARVLARELCLDFGPEPVSHVEQDGNKVTIHFRTAARPV